MNPCTVKRGIFSLHECGNHASEICSTCQRPLCLEHANYGREAILCPQCFAMTPDAKKPDETDDGSDDAADWDSPGWSQRWRDNYYESRPYQPIAAYGASRYDDYDRHAFSARSDGVADESDAGAAGFSDS